ncbi:MAG: EAL domain-containing response regulator [Rubrivivax sp.]|nr:MAG: EAL domain-containing response regulator [Rubrivivax sp.]
MSTSRPGDSTWNDALVMMIDDESLMTDVIQTHLEDAGYSRFVACHEPRQAIDLVREHHPDVLLLDLMMPEVSGFDILTAVRADPALQYTPVIVLTAASEPATKLRALEIGATEFLAKPVDASELVLRVRNTLAFKRHQDRLAYVDAATGLSNRARFTRRLEQAIEHALPRQGTVGLLHVAFDQFRQVGESLGSRAADALLKLVAQRLIATIEPDHDEDIARLHPESLDLARVGDQDFALLLPDLPDAEAAADIAKLLLQSLALPFDVEGHTVFLQPGVGIALAPGDAQHADGLLNNASLACTKAQGHGKGYHEFFSEELTARSLARLTLTHQLRLALERQELRLHYQPKVCLRSGQIIGAEALVRWQHPEHGLLLPGRFIPHAEENGLIVEIGDWVTQEACEQASRWHRQGMPPISIAINISQPQFDNGRVHRQLQSLLARTGLPPSWLVIEVTESLLAVDADRALHHMNELRGLGLNLSLDDFGTGYSSLSYLKRFPAGELKVDRSFVIDLVNNPKDRAIVQTIIDLGHNLSMKVVAEGVESIAQLRALQHMGCDVFQGFLFSKAVEPAAFEQLVQDQAAMALVEPSQFAA